MRAIHFHRTKYGPEILIDIAWIRDMPTFLIGEPHALSFHDITLVTAGTGTFQLDGHGHPVRPGQVLFSAPGQVRGWDVRGLDGICLFFPALFLEEFFSDSAFLQRLPYFHDAERASLRQPPRSALALRRRLLAMRRELRAQRPDGTHLLRAALYEILITLAREYAGAHGVPRERSIHPTVLRFVKLVDRGFRRRHGVDAYARELGVSSGHLSTICRKHLGRSAKAVIQQRLDVEARRLLLFTDDSAQGIGYSLGFEDPSYFTRFVRRRTGRAPSDFRARRGSITR